MCQMLHSLSELLTKGGESSENNKDHHESIACFDNITYMGNICYFLVGYNNNTSLYLYYSLLRIKTSYKGITISKFIPCNRTHEIMRVDTEIVKLS